MEVHGWRIFGASHVLCSAAVIAFIGSILKDYVVDDGLIYAKFATCLADGGNWTFNCGEAPVYATTSALWPMLLTGLLLIGIDQITAIPILNGVATLLLASAVGFLFPKDRAGLRLIVGVSISALPLIWRSQGLEVVLACALVAWTIVAFIQKREQASGILLGLAVLARPDSALLAPILLIVALIQEHRVPWRAMLWSAAVVMPWLIFAWATFGSVLPDTLSAKVAQSGLEDWWPSPPFLEAVDIEVRTISFFLYPFCTAGILLAVVAIKEKGIRSMQHNLGPFLFATYGIIHGACYSLLDVSSGYFWYMIPLTSGVLILAILGVGELAELTENRKGRAFVLVLLGPLMFWSCWSGAFEIPASYRLSNEYRSVSRHLSETATSGEEVASVEIGYIGYFSNVKVLDVHALIHPEEQQAIRSGDVLWWIDRSPAWIIVHSPRWFGEPGFKGLRSDYLEDGYELAERSGAIELWRRK